MKEHKLRSGVGVSWQGASKPKGVKQGFGVYACSHMDPLIPITVLQERLYSSYRDEKCVRILVENVKGEDPWNVSINWQNNIKPNTTQSGCDFLN